jgi:hypothetical protein
MRKAATRSLRPFFLLREDESTFGKTATTPCDLDPLIGLRYFTKQLIKPLVKYKC